MPKRYSLLLPLLQLVMVYGRCYLVLQYWHLSESTQVPSLHYLLWISDVSWGNSQPFAAAICNAVWFSRVTAFTSASFCSNSCTSAVLLLIHANNRELQPESFFWFTRNSAVTLAGLKSNNACAEVKCPFWHAAWRGVDPSSVHSITVQMFETCMKMYTFKCFARRFHQESNHLLNSKLCTGIQWCFFNSSPSRYSMTKFDQQLRKIPFTFVDESNYSISWYKRMRLVGN